MFQPFCKLEKKLKHIRIRIFGVHAFAVTPGNAETFKVKKLPKAADRRIVLRSTSLALEHSVLELNTSANPSLMVGVTAEVSCATSQ